jgi:hypothetical protein
MGSDTMRRAKHLLSGGWKHVEEPTRELNADDPRWAIVGSRERATGETFEQATAAAYASQKAREALDLRDEERARTAPA